MAERVFALNTTPHVAVIGETRLLFQPEVVGAEFAQAYDKLRGVQVMAKVKAKQGQKASSTKHARDAEDLDAASMTELSDAMKEFIGSFLLDESKPVFESLRLPDRIMVDLMEWAAELYGGGSGNPDAGGGMSSG